jgi:hypothetical protein
MRDDDHIPDTPDDVDVERRMTPGAIACATPLFLGVALTVILAVMFFGFLIFG